MCIYCLIENSLSKNLHMYNILKLFFLAIRNICLLILKWVQVNLWTDSYSFICFSISCFKIIVFLFFSRFHSFVYLVIVYFFKQNPYYILYIYINSKLLLSYQHCQIDVSMLTYIQINIHTHTLR